MTNIAPGWCFCSAFSGEIDKNKFNQASCRAASSALLNHPIERTVLRASGPRSSTKFNYSDFAKSCRRITLWDFEPQKIFSKIKRFARRWSGNRARTMRRETLWEFFGRKWIWRILRAAKILKIYIDSFQKLDEFSIFYHAKSVFASLLKLWTVWNFVDGKP